jgi:hypothetical protein
MNLFRPGLRRLSTPAARDAFVYRFVSRDGKPRMDPPMHP